MITIRDNDIHRDGEKIGWLRENDIYGEDNKKLGYFTNNDIYRASGVKLGYLRGDEVHKEDGSTIDIEENRRYVSGGSISDLERAAIRLIFG